MNTPIVPSRCCETLDLHEPGQVLEHLIALVEQIGRRVRTGREHLLVDLRDARAERADLIRVGRDARANLVADRAHPLIEALEPRNGVARLGEQRLARGER